MGVGLVASILELDCGYAGKSSRVGRQVYSHLGIAIYTSIRVLYPYTILSVWLPAAIRTRSTRPGSLLFYKLIIAHSNV
jgi:hypothetical protein